MSTKNILFGFVGALIVFALVFWVFNSTANKKVVLPVLTVSENVRVTTPLSGTLATSPLVIRGEARGGWFFEASFPVRLLDDSGKELARTQAHAQGDWMTTNFVPFEATLTFTTPQTKKGMLVFEKDNPSGLAQNAGSFLMPIIFK